MELSLPASSKPNERMKSSSEQDVDTLCHVEGVDSDRSDTLALLLMGGWFLLNDTVWDN